MQLFLSTLIVGLVTGSVYALASTGLVLTYRTSGVLNLGYGALAIFTSFVHWQLTVRWGWPGWASALVVVTLVAPLVGFILEEGIFSKLRDQPIVIGVIATVGVWVLLQGIIQLIWGPGTQRVPSLFPHGTVRILGSTRIGIDQIAILLISVAAVVLLAGMLRYTRLGISFRAVVDNRDLAGLMAVPTSVVSGGAWAIGTSFAALMGILLTPRLLLDQDYLPPFIIAFVLGSAMVGYLRSLPLAYAGGLLLGVIQAFFVQYATFRGVWGELGNAAPFLLITIFVLAAPRRYRLAAASASFMVRTREVASGAIPKASKLVGPVVFGVLALVPLIHSVSWKNYVAEGMIFSIVFLSLVVLTGFSGQISFGHTAFMGISAFTAAHLAAVHHMPVWLAGILGAFAAIPAGVLIGVIAVRLHGLYLALMTLAFAFMCQQMFFSQPLVSGSEGLIHMPRPEWFRSDTAFFYLSLGSLAVFVLLAWNLRTGRTGRVLAALRDSETGSRALGINVRRYKVAIFTLSAFMAGSGAILLHMQTFQVERLAFFPFYSLIYITVAVLAGLFSVGGAITAGMIWALYPKIFESYPVMGKLQYILFGLGATVALARNPAGTYGELRNLGVLVMRSFTRSREVVQVSGAQK
ncbi:MAG: ABC transporter permease [Actinomycetota bacterium]